MRNVTSLIFVWLLALLLTGCATTHFQLQETNGDGAEHRDLQHYFIDGLGQEVHINPVEICGGLDKIQSIETLTPFKHGLLRWVTFGVYSPQRARVSCLP